MKNLNKYEHCSNCPSRGKGIFCELEELALNDLSHQKITNIFKKGQTLFVQGGPPFGLYCISQGNVKITKSSSDGKEAIVRIASAGDVLGHRSVFSNENYGATATAIEDSSVCFIDRKYILKLVQEQPTVACNLISRLGKQLGAADDKIASFSQKNVFERTCEVLLLLKETHSHEEDGKFRIDIKITREELASIVGTATETLIRIMSELKDEGVIEQDGKIIIISSPKKLMDFANISY